MYLALPGNSGGDWPTNDDLIAWMADGNTFGIHPWRSDTTPMAAAFTAVDDWFQGDYTVSRSNTVRTHRLEWQGWTEAADIAAAHGLALDTSFYHWGPWLQMPNGSYPHGYITGSGLPMKFVREDGTLTSVYQQLTEMADDHLFAEHDPAPGMTEEITGAEAVAISKSLIDASLGGYYSALMHIHHVDNYSTNVQSPIWLRGALDYAYSKGVPMWNADQWLRFTATRHDANYTNLVWNGSTGVLSFNINMAATAGMTPTTILPLNYGGRSLKSVTVDGGPYTYSTQAIKSTTPNVAFVSIPAGNHSVSADYGSSGKLPQTITFNSLPDKVYGDPSFTVSATASSGLTVTFTASGACSITGATVSLTGAGSCTVTAHQPGNATYDPAPDVPRTFTIAKGNQTITFNPLGNKTYGDPAFTVAATATSGLTVTFTASGACSITGATVSLTGAGSCTVTAHQPGDANYNAAPDVPRTFTIAKGNQTITFNPLGNKAYGDPVFTVAATATSGLTVTFTASGACSITGATVSLTGVGSCTVTAHQPGDANYNAAPDVPQTFTIAKGNQTITFNPLGNKTYGDPAFAVAATATSGLTVTFTASGACSITDATVSLTGVGSCTVTAHQPGDANYNAAPDVPQNLHDRQRQSDDHVQSAGEQGLWRPGLHGGGDSQLGPDGDVHGERGVQHHWRHGEPDGSGELHGDGASVGRRQLQRRAGRAADLHDRQTHSDDHVQSAGKQDLWRPGLHGVGDSQLGPDGNVHGERGVQHHGRHGEPDGGGELHGDGASVGRRQLQCRAGRAADLHDRQRQPDDHVQSAGEQGLWRPGLHGGGDSHFGPDGDIHGERGVQHHWRHGEPDGGGELHGDGASVGRCQLQCRAGRAADLHDCQRQPDDHVQSAGEQGLWRPGLHGGGDSHLGPDGDVHGERGVQHHGRHGEPDGGGELHGDGASVGRRQLQCRAGRAANLHDRQKQSDDHVQSAGEQGLWRPGLHGGGDSHLGPDGDVHGERGVQHHGRHGEPDGGRELHGDGASAGRRQLQCRAGRAANLHDRQRQSDDHVQSAGEQGLWRPGLHGGGDSQLGPDGDVHGERGVQHHGRHGEPDGGGELHGDGTSVGRRQLQCRAGRAANLHDRQRQSDDYVWAAAGSGGWCPAVRGDGERLIKAGSDLYGERAVQRCRRYSDLDGHCRDLHGDGASSGEQQLQRRAGGPADLQDHVQDLPAFHHVGWLLAQAGAEEIVSTRISVSHGGVIIYQSCGDDNRLGDRRWSATAWNNGGYRLLPDLRIAENAIAVVAPLG